MNKNKYLFEIGVEELPTSYIQPAMKFMNAYFDEYLHRNTINYESIEKFSTPRRLALTIDGLPDKQEDTQKEIIGPPKRIAYDPNDNLNSVGLGFLKKQNLLAKDIVIKKLEKGEYLTAIKVIKGKSTEEILTQISINIISKIPFPKTMKWDNKGILFARPIRWIVALFNQHILPLHIGNVESGRYSSGNRFEALNNKFEIKNVEEYQSDLERHFVIPNRVKRKNLIIKQLNATANEVNGLPTENSQLVETVTDLVEYPSPILGKFDESFLNLPREVLITTLSETQKCFSVSNQNEKLIPYFICFSNSNPKTTDKVRYGNERVINARLADAKFYFDTDKKTKLADRVGTLKKITFQKNLGTLFDKIKRMEKLGKYLAEILHYDSEKINRAILLSKTDLTTLMLGEKEYTKLQGFMGWQYALNDDEDKEVAKAIFEQYLPRYKDDILPDTKTGVVLSIIDKLDTICGCFAVKLIPSGSYDPLGLRRAGNGIIRILDNRNLPIQLVHLIDRSLASFVEVAKKDIDSTKSDLVLFFKQRIRNYLENYGIDYDVIDSVMSIGFSDVTDLKQRALDLQKFKQRKDFTKLVLGFKRVSNIISEVEKMEEVKPELLEEQAEKNLFNKYTTLSRVIKKCLEKKDYEKVMENLVEYGSHIDNFFDKVLVNVEDKVLRKNRYNLLCMIRKLFLQVADISKIVVKGQNNQSNNK